MESFDEFISTSEQESRVFSEAPLDFSIKSTSTASPPVDRSSVYEEYHHTDIKLVKRDLDTVTERGFSHHQLPAYSSQQPQASTSSHSYIPIPSRAAMLNELQILHKSPERFNRDAQLTKDFERDFVALAEPFNETRDHVPFGMPLHLPNISSFSADTSRGALSPTASNFQNNQRPFKRALPMIKDKEPTREEMMRQYSSPTISRSRTYFSNMYSDYPVTTLSFSRDIVINPSKAKIYNVQPSHQMFRSGPMCNNGGASGSGLSNSSAIKHQIGDEAPRTSSSTSRSPPNWTRSAVQITEVASSRQAKRVPEEQKNEDYYKKRQRNNLAAKKSRENRRKKEDDLGRNYMNLQETFKFLRAYLDDTLAKYHQLESRAQCLSIEKQRLIEENINLQRENAKIRNERRRMSWDYNRSPEAFHRENHDKSDAPYNNID